MSILDTATTVERRIEAASPLWWVRYVVWGVVALIVIGLAWLVIDRLFFAPGRAADAAARAKDEAIIADGNAKAAGDAQRTVVDHYTHDAVTVTLQQKGSADVQAAAGSRDPFPATVGDAGRRAICMYAAASRDPACVELHDAGAGGMDAGRSVRADPAH